MDVGIDIFVHPEAPYFDKKIGTREDYAAYLARIRQIAQDSDCPIHIADPHLDDSVLDDVLPTGHTVPSFSYGPIHIWGAVGENAWNQYKQLLVDNGALEGVPVRVHGAYMGMCMLDAAVQASGLIDHGKEWPATYRVSEYVLNLLTGHRLGLAFPFANDIDDVRTTLAESRDASVRLGTGYVMGSSLRRERVRLLPRYEGLAEEDRGLYLFPRGANSRMMAAFS